MKKTKIMVALLALIVVVATTAATGCYDDGGNRAYEGGYEYPAYGGVYPPNGFEYAPYEGGFGYPLAGGFAWNHRDNGERHHWDGDHDRDDFGASHHGGERNHSAFARDEGHEADGRR